MAAQQGIALLLRNALELLSSLRGRSWHSNSKLLQQVTGIGQVGSKALYNCGVSSIYDLRCCEESRLEVLLKRNPPFGHNLKKVLRTQFPSVTFDCNLKNDLIRLTIKSTDNAFESQWKPLVHVLVLAYTSQTSCRILLYDQIPLHALPLNRTIQISKCKEQSFSCSLMFEDWAGLNQNICLDIEKQLETVQKRKDEFDISSDIDLNMIEEYETKDSLRDVKVKEITCADLHPPSPVSSMSTKTLNPTKCKHPCKDKLNCAHVCCKSGLLSKRRLSGNMTEITEPAAKKSATFLAGTRRSLSNAREYLRQYQPVDIKAQSVSSLLPAVQVTNDLYEEIEFVLR